MILTTLYKIQNKEGNSPKLIFLTLIYQFFFNRNHEISEYDATSYDYVRNSRVQAQICKLQLVNRRDTFLGRFKTLYMLVFTVQERYSSLSIAYDSRKKLL